MFPTELLLLAAEDAGLPDDYNRRPTPAPQTVFLVLMWAAPVICVSHNEAAFCVRTRTQTELKTPVASAPRTGRFTWTVFTKETWNDDIPPRKADFPVLKETVQPFYSRF